MNIQNVEIVDLHLNFIIHNNNKSILMKFTDFANCKDITQQNIKYFKGFSLSVITTDKVNCQIDDNFNIFEMRNWILNTFLLCNVNNEHVNFNNSEIKRKNGIITRIRKNKFNSLHAVENYLKLITLITQVKH